MPAPPHAAATPNLMLRWLDPRTGSCDLVAKTMEEKPVSAPPIAIGELQVQRIEENCGPFFPPSVLLPDLPPDALQRHRDWIAPNYYDEAQDLLVASIHSWRLCCRFCG
jgi:hypothetical protein